jgi:hypothetical protein
MTSVSLSTSTYAYNLSYQCVCRTCHKPAKVFTCDTRFLSCWQYLNRIYFLIEVLFFHEPLESLIVGSSDIGQVSTAMSSTDFKVFLSTYNIIERLSFFHKGGVFKDTEQDISTKEFIHDPVITQDLVCFI